VWSRGDNLRSNLGHNSVGGCFGAWWNMVHWATGCVVECHCIERVRLGVDFHQPDIEIF
jgi:hypothetical protein